MAELTRRKWGKLLEAEWREELEEFNKLAEK